MRQGSRSHLIRRDTQTTRPLSYVRTMAIVNRIVNAIIVIITAPFRAIAALFGKRSKNP